MVLSDLLLLIALPAHRADKNRDVPVTEEETEDQDRLCA